MSGLIVDDDHDNGAKFEHRVFVAGYSMHVLAGTFTTIAAFLDFNWQSPAVPKFGDPEEPISNIGMALTVFMLFYLATNIPATLTWSTSAGWTPNTGFIWLLAAAGFYERLRKKRNRVAASTLQSLFGIVALGLSVAVGDQNGFHPFYGGESHWIGSILLLLVSVLLTICAAVLAIFSPVHNVEVEAKGWAAASKTDESDRDILRRRKETFHRVNPERCGDLGICGICDLVCSIILFFLWFVLVALAADFRVNEPATSCYAILPMDTPTLDISNIARSQSVTIGPYEFTTDEDGKRFSVNRGSALVFSNVLGEPFVRAAFGPFRADNQHEMGTFNIVDGNRMLSTTQTIDAITTDSVTFLTITGFLGGLIPEAADKIAYNVTFTQPAGTNHLAFDFAVDESGLTSVAGSAFDSANDAIRLYWVHTSSPEERFFGFGQSFTYFDLKGTCVPIISREQGIGRGLQPFTYLVNKVSHGGAGSWQTTYSAVPHYVTSTSRSFFLTEAFFSVFDLTRSDRVGVELVASRMRGRFIAESSYLDIIEQYTLFSGRMRPLPDWVGSGAVIGLQGGTAVVKRQIDELEANGVPLAGVWLQDWTGKRETGFGDRLLWNWQVDEEFYPGWWDLIAELRVKDVSMLTYINPYLANEAPNRDGVRVVQPMYSEAKDLGCLIRNQDDSVLIQISATSDFTFATVDLTNPTCRAWYVDVIRNNMMNVSAAAGGQAFGALGWMADFGESVPFNAKLFSGRADEVHNIFPALWAETCREAISTVAGGVNFTEEATFFTRSSSLLSPQYTTLMWMGDQMQAFNKFDGLETVVPAIASMGFSGFSLAHSDVGGYLGFFQLGGLIQVTRSRELLWRWMELSGFIDTMYRSHEGNLPTKSAQVTSDNCTMMQFGRFARIFRALLPYRKLLMQEAATRGVPVARHPLLHFQSDRNLDKIQSQIMLGSELMLCPVTRSSTSSTSCYLPAGSGAWTNFFNLEQTPDAGSNGLTFTCSAPLGRPCALFRAGATNVAAARDALVSEGFDFLQEEDDCV